MNTWGSNILQSCMQSRNKIPVKFLFRQSPSQFLGATPALPLEISSLTPCTNTIGTTCMLYIKMYAQYIPLITHELPELYSFSAVFWVNNTGRKKTQTNKKKRSVFPVFWNVYFGVRKYYVGFTVLWYFCLSYSRSNLNSPSQGEGGNHSNPRLHGTNGIYSWLLPKKSYHQ